MIGDWIDRLGAIWVEGQITQISRRPGAGIVFLTLRDPSQDVSVGVTCYRRVFEQVVPAPSEGARVVVCGRSRTSTGSAGSSRCSRRSCGRSASGNCWPG